MKPPLFAGLALALLVLAGCVPSPAKIVTTPIKMVSKASDWATVSGDEADRARGRTLRRKCKDHYDAYYCEK